MQVFFNTKFIETMAFKRTTKIIKILSILKSYNRFVLRNNNLSCYSLKGMKKNGMSASGIRKLINTKSFDMTSDDYRLL